MSHTVGHVGHASHSSLRFASPGGYPGLAIPSLLAAWRVADEMN